MQKRWMPTAAGVLNVLNAAMLMVGAIIMLSLPGTPMGEAITGYVMYSLDATGEVSASAIAWVLGVTAGVLVAFGAVSLVGGICMLRRRRWGLGLAGSSATLITQFYLGIPATVLTGLSRSEFRR